MMPTTSSFYVTLTSDPTKEFPDNTTTTFKNRLPMAIRLFALGWKVGMTSITLPDPQRPPFLETTDPTARLCQLGWYEKIDNNVQYKSLTIRKNDIVKRLGMRFTPTHLMHSIMDMYVESKLDQTNPGGTFQHADDRNPHGTISQLIDTSHTFQWTQEGDLLWDNTKTSPYTYQPRLNFQVPFALKMGWLINNGDGTYNLGKNIEEIPIRTDLIRSQGDIIEMRRALRIAGKSVQQGGKYWFVEENDLMWLSDAISWKFLFHSDTERHNSRMLFVYSNAVQSSIYNNKVVNLLSEVLYKKEGEGSAYFEPTTIRHLPLRTSILETVETHIEDSSGQPIDFQGSKTILSLHFTRDLLP